MAVGWAVLLGKQITEQLVRDTGTDTRGVMIAAALIVSLLLFAAYLVWSRDVRSFLIR